MLEKYNFTEIEAKWQKHWEETKAFKVVEDPDNCIDIKIETITGVTVSTFIDDLEGFIRDKYLPVVIMAAHEKIRSITTMVGMPIRLPNPVFGQPMVKMEGFPQ